MTAKRKRKRKRKPWTAEPTVLDRYWLASYYRVDPRIFLSMPENEFRGHLKWTITLNEKMRHEFKRPR